MVATVIAPGQPGGLLAERQTAPEHPPADPAVMKADSMRREPPTGESVLAAGLEGPVGAMEGPGEGPGEAERPHAPVAIRVSETDAEWWFG
jgi:hypothetical protein